MFFVLTFEVFSHNCCNLFQTEVCNKESVKSTSCKEINEVSEQLKNIYDKEAPKIVEDIKSTVNIIEKIVDNVTPDNIAETPKVRNV